MFNSTAMAEQGVIDMRTISRAKNAPPALIELFLEYHEKLVLPRFHKIDDISEYHEKFMEDLIQRLREAEVLQDETPATVHGRLTQRIRQLEKRVDQLTTELKAQATAHAERRTNHRGRSLEEQVRDAQYEAYQRRGRSRRPPSRDGSFRCGTEDNGLPVSEEALYDAVCRGLREATDRGSRATSSDAGESVASSSAWVPSEPSEWVQAACPTTTAWVYCSAPM